MRKQTRISDGILLWLTRAATYLVVLFVSLLVAVIVKKGAPVISLSFLTTARILARWRAVFSAPLIDLLLGIGHPGGGGSVGHGFGDIPVGIRSPNQVKRCYCYGHYHAGRDFLDRIRVIWRRSVCAVSAFWRRLLSGSLTLACMVLPTIIVASEEALRAVPPSLREGSLALGATKWQTIYKNVLPYAIPGMLTGSILGMSRAAGETAPIMLTAAFVYTQGIPRSIFDKVMALSYHLYALLTQVPDISKARPIAYGTALVLLLVVLGMNLVAILLRSYFRKRIQW